MSCYSSMCEASIKYMKDYNHHILIIGDVNNLYGWEMLQSGLKIHLNLVVIL